MSLPGVSLGDTRLVLASGSPRRARLLQLLGLDFDVIASNYDESKKDYEIPEVQVLDLSLLKAEAVTADVPSGLIVGADTIVVIDNRILGKPDSRKEARQMLRELSGRVHEVYTGIALIERPSGRIVNEYEKTRVHFRDLDEAEIEQYVESDHPLDKAGAYGIQDLSAIFVHRIEGCFYNVVGFPIARFHTALKSLIG